MKGMIHLVNSGKFLVLVKIHSYLLKLSNSKKKNKIDNPLHKPIRAYS